VYGNGAITDFSKYSVSVIHSQNNYYTLSENDAVEDYITQHSYRYYKFSVPDATHVKNITFIMNTYHGDADLFASITHKFPNKHDNEKSSQRVTGLLDFVYFD
jgi:hypothetical protein